MESKKFVKRFKSRQELLDYGEQQLRIELLDVIDDIDDIYLTRNSMCVNIIKLMQFKSYEEMKSEMSEISIKSFKGLDGYISRLVKNIFVQVKDENSFISKQFKTYYGDRDLEIRVELQGWIKGESDIKHYELRISLMSLIKGGGSGNGNSWSVDLIDSVKLNSIIDEVESSDLPQGVKNEYIEFFNQSTEDYLSMEEAHKEIVGWIKRRIKEYIALNEDELKIRNSFKDLSLIEKIKSHMIEEGMTDILQGVNFEYESIDGLSHPVENENSIIVKFLGEEIKTISKVAYTDYNIYY